ncbi:hypothetical protein ACKGJO_06765 [Gracilimonas sp. Q87]|uniref:hypothetical protein n=1 Tax=Gracilimonas sp. Q87 TaxID=3384766 RepID=UPI0039843933
MELSHIIEHILALDYDDRETEIGNYKISIHYDDWAESPRDWDNFGTMVCGHNRYTLGDEQWSPEFASEYGMFEYFHSMSGLFPDKGYYSEFTDEEFQRIEEWVDQNIIWLPLYLYDHSGITMSTSSFSCRWDSGMVGFIWVSREDARKNYHWNRISKQREERVYDHLRAEVETYDEYLRGNVHSFVVEYEDEIIDSCAGFLGDWHSDDGMGRHMITDNIVPAVEHHYKKRLDTRFEKVKALINNCVPITKRPQLIANL